MAVSANQLIQAQDPGGRRSIPVGAAIHIYQGTMVFVEQTSGAGAGYASDIIDGGTNDFFGIAVAEADNSGGSAGDINVEVYTLGAFVLVGVGFAQEQVGDLAYATDNYVITSVSSSMAPIGSFSEFISSTKMRVDIDTIQATR